MPLSHYRQCNFCKGKREQNSWGSQIFKLDCFQWLRHQQLIKNKTLSSISGAVNFQSWTKLTTTPPHPTPNKQQQINNNNNNKTLKVEVLPEGSTYSSLTNKSITGILKDTSPPPPPPPTIPLYLDKIWTNGQMGRQKYTAIPVYYSKFCFGSVMNILQSTVMSELICILHKFRTMIMTTNYVQPKPIFVFYLFFFTYFFTKFCNKTINDTW